MFQFSNSKQFKYFCILICSFAFCILHFAFCSAAILYLEPASGEYQHGDTFIIEIRLDSEQEYINAVEANLTFPQDILEVQDFSQGNSILTLWVKFPTIDGDSGLVSFAGGVPGGYEGTDGLLGKIVFSVVLRDVLRGSAQVVFQDDSQVLLNDGLGSKAKLTTKGAEFSILPEIPEVSKDEWQEELEKDKIPPETFEIEISQDSSVFEGKYFITFSTTDKQTGIDYFEIKEGKRDWKKGESPYLLEDQSLSGIIKVRAVDKAGNVRIAEYTPPYKINVWQIIIYLILILVGLGVIWWLWKRYTKHH